MNLYLSVNHLEALVMHKTQMTNLSGIVGIMVTLVDTLSYQKALSKDSQEEVLHLKMNLWNFWNLNKPILLSITRDGIIRHPFILSLYIGSWHPWALSWVMQVSPSCINLNIYVIWVMIIIQLSLLWHIQICFKPAILIYHSAFVCIIV